MASSDISAEECLANNRVFRKELQQILVIYLERKGLNSVLG